MCDTLSEVKLMKTLKKILLTILVLVIGLTLVSFNWEGEFAWEGELDPNKFDEWEFLYVQLNNQGNMWVFIKNPDEKSPIDIVAIEINLPSFSLISYRYFKYNEPYSYVFDSKQEKFVRNHLTKEQKEECMKCHDGKVIPRIETKNLIGDFKNG